MKSKTLTIHAVDPAVDEARQFLFESLLVRNRVETIAFMRASEPSTVESPGKYLTGDPSCTDGMRLVVFISGELIPTNKARDLGWGKTLQGPIEFNQRKRR